MKKSLLATAIVLAAATVSTQAMAYQKGDWVVRFGATSVSPDDSSSNLVVGGSDLGLGVTVDSNTQLGLNLAYFFTDRWNVEVLAATPFTHDVDFGVADPLGTGDKLGEVTHLPPTVTANYYFGAADAKFQPYVGAGINYTIFFDEEFTSANDAAGLADLDLDSSFGLSAQVGFDYAIDEKWHVNASARWIDIDTDASFNLGGTPGSVSVDIDPWVYTLSLIHI